MYKLRNLPNNWRLIKHHEISQINPKLPSNSCADDMIVSFIPMKAVEAGSGKFDLSEERKFETVKKGYTSFIDGDVIFAKITPCMENGKAALLEKLKNGIGFGSTEFHVSRPVTSFDNQFLFFYLIQESFRKEAQKNMTGSAGQLRVPKNFFENISIPLPPLKEQHRIVTRIEELFSHLDSGINSLKKARNQLKIYRQAVLKYAFEGKLTEEWRKQHQPEPAENLLERIRLERERHHQQQLEEWKAACERAKAEGEKKPVKPRKPKELPPLTEEELGELPALPEGWCYTYLSYLGDLARGKSKHRPRNDKNLFGGKYPFIQTGEIKAAKRIINDFSKTYNEIGLSQSKLWPRGTLCITIAANIAETAFLGIEACFPDSIVGFTAHKSLIVSQFVDYFIEATKEQIEAFAPATAQKNINLTTLENLLIPYCALQEQHAIVQEIESRLSICDQLEQTIETNLKKADALRQSILKKAFEGKLVPQNPDDEPAEKLLERIKAEKAEREAKTKAAKAKKRNPKRSKK